MRGWISIFLALVIHLACFILTLHRVEPFYTDFYSLAWWTYLFFLAGVNHLRGRNSLLLDNPRKALWVFLYSTPVWLLFELYNLRIGNWAYLGVPVEIYWRWPGYFVAYGTVLPGILETETFLRNLGVFRQVTGPRLRAKTRLLVRFMIPGTLMMAAPLIYPDLFFPTLWLGLIFLLDPLLYRWGEGEASLLRKAERGDYALLVRLLVAGLVCGFLWEFWNHWAGAKWIYTLPHFRFWQIFEMPTLGYLGFPPFALECYLLYQVFLLFRERFLYGRPWTAPVTAILAAIYCMVAFLAIDHLTIATFKSIR